MPPAIEIENVSFKYEFAEAPAISEVDLSIGRGEFLLIAGLSGSGKSTLLRLLNGLIPHFYRGEMTGRVLVDGVDTREASVAELSRRVGLVFQNPDNQIVTLKVEREIAFGMENLGVLREEMRRRVREIADLLGIEHLLGRWTYELSGGEKQLVAIASVLAMRPDIIALDEPTSELDPFSAARIARALLRLKGLGYTIVVVEHRLELFAPLADRMAVMFGGKIVALGETREILYDPEIERYGVKRPSIVSSAMELGLSNVKPLTVGEALAWLRR